MAEAAFTELRSVAGKLYEIISLSNYAMMVGNVTLQLHASPKISHPFHLNNADFHVFPISTRRISLLHVIGPRENHLSLTVVDHGLCNELNRANKKKFQFTL